MATNYPANFDGETELPTTPITEGTTPGHNTHTVNAHGAIQQLEQRAGKGTDLAAAASAGMVWTKRADGTTGFVLPVGTGHTVLDEAVQLAQRGKLAFVGTGVTATDDAVNDKTIVTIPSTPATTFPRPALVVVYSNDFPAALKTTVDGIWAYNCDAVSDEVEINAAITQAALTRGDVLLLGLTYATAAPMLLKTGVTLRGLGMNTTRIEAATGFVGTSMLSLASVDIHATETSNIWLDGKNVAGISGIAFDNTGGVFTGAPSTSPDPSHSVHDARIYSCAAKGLWLVGNNRGSEFHHLYIMNAGAEGLRVEATDCDFANIQIGSSGTVGAYLAGGNCRYVNLKSWFSDSHGFQLSTALRQALTNCESQDNLGNGFLCTSGKSSLVGCHADSNSYDGSPSGAITGRTYYGFDVRSTAGLIIQACEAYDKNEGNRGARQLYGFIFNATTDHGLCDAVTYGNFSGSVSGAPGADFTTRIKSVDGF